MKISFENRGSQICQMGARRYLQHSTERSEKKRVTGVPFRDAEELLRWK